MTAAIGAAETAFLQAPRLAMFSTAVGQAWSRPVPVWYDWNGSLVTVFSFHSAPKVARLRADPRAHVLVANNAQEAEHWVSISGPVEITTVDPAWLEGVAARYWDLSDPEKAKVVASWVAVIDQLVSLELTPTEVHRYGF
jgi:general stress protein 26